MTQDIGLDIATGPTLTLLAADLADANQSAFSAVVDLGAVAPLMFGYRWKITTLASAVNALHLEAAFGYDNTNLSHADNLYLVDTADCVASSTFYLSGRFPVLGRYAKFRMRNESGGSIDGTPNTQTELHLWDLFGDQA